MATKRTPPKAGKKPAAKPASPAVRATVRTAATASTAAMSVLDGSMKPLIRAAFAKRLRG